MLTAAETQVLRTLAQQYMEYALAPHQKEVQDLWIAHNTGHSQRPMVIIDQIPWNEMDVDGFLQCQIQDSYWRGVEWNLRCTIYRAKYMPADLLFPPYLLIPRILVDNGYRDFGIKIQESTVSTDPKSGVVSHAYVKQFETMEDLEKIRPTQLRVNKEAEAAAMDEAKRIFEGIAPVYWQGVTFHSGLWDSISTWQGVQECYFMLLDEPEIIHAMMERMTQYTLDLIRQGNEDGLFNTAFPECHCSQTLVKPFGSGMEERPGTSKNSWTFGLAQLFSSVSPEITEEFEVPYMQRIFKEFGDVYYGCCERLDDRLDVLEKLPNVRKISCSPWSNPQKFASNLNPRYIMSNKPNPAFVAVGDVEASRKEMETVMQAAKSNHIRLEMILKDNSTVHYHPERLWDFNRMAMELVQA